MPPKLSNRFYESRLALVFVAMTGLLFMGVYSADAQDVARPSLGGQRAATPLAASSIPASRYNVKVGPVKMLFSASMGTAYNSNVNVSNDNPIADMVLTPRVGVGVYWPITKTNKLRFNIEAGYDYYVNQPELGNETFVIGPSTEFFFNLGIGDVLITLFDRPSITVNPVDNVTLSNAQNYAMFSNTAGIDVVWDLNDVQLGIGYSNLMNYSLVDEFNYLNRVSNQLYANASLLVLPYLRTGLEGSATTTIYQQGSSPGANALNNSVGYTGGLFAQGNVSRYLDWIGGVGWQLTDFNESNNPLNTGNASNPYFYLTLDNTLNRDFSHRLTTGFEAAPSSESNFVDLFFIRYGFNWLLIRDWSLGGGLFYERGGDSPGPQSEDFNRYGANLGLSYMLTKNWLLGAYYTIINKDSSVSQDAYFQQVIGINVTYNF
jgi:hypothetical protein